MRYNTVSTQTTEVVSRKPAIVTPNRIHVLTGFIMLYAQMENMWQPVRLSLCQHGASYHYKVVEIRMESKSIHLAQYQ